MNIHDTLTEIAMQADNSMAPHLTDNDELSPVDALARISKLAWAALDDSTKAEQTLPETGTPPCELECELIDERSCGAKNKGYTCSRNINHDGDHVACGFNHAYHVWPNEQSKITSGDVDKSRPLVQGHIHQLAIDVLVALEAACLKNDIILSRKKENA